MPAKDNFDAPADVRVRGIVGQQPLEAYRLHPQLFVLQANLFDHVFQKGDPEGISMNAPVPHQASRKPHTERFTRLPSKGRQGRPLPPMVLSRHGYHHVNILSPTPRRACSNQAGAGYQIVSRGLRKTSQAQAISA